MAGEGERRITDCRVWFAEAGKDLRGAAALLRLAPPLTGRVMFFAQQAVEKGLKGFLTWHDTPLKRTHDLHQLGRRCSEIDGTVELVMFRVAYLTKFAVAGRYPGEGQDPTPSEARKALKLAREAVKVLLERLPLAVRPRGIRL